jgi:hypothetical protein
MKAFDDYQEKKLAFGSSAADLKIAAATLHNAIDGEVKDAVLSGAITLGTVQVKEEPSTDPNKTAEGAASTGNESIAKPVDAADASAQAPPTT